MGRCLTGSRLFGFRRHWTDCRRPQGCHGNGCCHRLRKIKDGCAKSYLVAVNLVFLIGGSTVLGLGLWIQLDGGQSLVFARIMHRIPTSGPVTLFDRFPSAFVFVGGSVAILSFLGCWGACAESACFLSLYVLLLCLVLVTEVIVATLFTVYRDKILSRLQAVLKNQIRSEYNKTAKASNSTAEAEYMTALIDTMHIKLNCCGSSGPEDFRFSAWFNRTRHVDEVFVPSSCCSTSGPDDVPKVKDENQCQIEAILSFGDRFTASRHLKTQGCYKTIADWSRRNTALFLVIIFICLSLQVLQLSSACVLMARLRQWQAEYGSENRDEVG